MKTRQLLLRCVLGLSAAALGQASLAFPVCSPESFVAAPSYPVGYRPGAVVVADFNGDLVPDIATLGDDFGGALSVLLGNGDGTFAPALTTEHGGTALVAADFDGDGNTDLALGGYDGVSILLGNGDGTFQAPVTYSIGGGFNLGLLVAEVTGDANLDLVILDSNPDITVLPGNGDGSFGERIVSPIEQGAGHLAAGDFDGDGKLDLAASLFNTVAVLKGNGHGMFGDTREFTVAPSISGIAVGDLDNDGNLDIGVTVSDYAEVVGGYVGILLGNGDRTFAAAIETRVKGDVTGLILRDFNGDGNLDAAVGAGDSFVVLLAGTGTASFFPVTPYLAASGVAALASGDLNLDGSPDIVAVNKYDGSVSILLDYGDGTFASPVGLFTGDDNYGLQEFAAGDINGDGKTDLVVLNSGGLWRYVATGRATFQPRTPLLASGLPASFALADFNGDGRLDVATHGDTPGMMTILISNGDGTFQAPAYYSLPLYDDGQVLVGDFNGDGRLDLATFSGTIVVLFGNGDGTFGPTATTTLSGYPYAPVTGDFNGDGRTDIAFVTEPELQVLLANVDGTFQTGAAYDLTTQPYGLAASSVTGDVHLDLVVADGNGGLLLFAGQGDGTFTGPATVSSGQFNVDVTAADFDGDGIVDLATSTAIPDGVSVLLGTGGGAFAAPLSYPTSRDPRRILAQPFGGTAPSIAVEGDDSTVTFLLNTRLTAAVGSVGVLVGSSANLEVSASGFGALSYQWRKAGVPIPGANGASFTIDPAAFTDAGSYDVLVTDSCTTVASGAGTLSVEFADVPVSSIFHADILTIATAGITAGCGGADYCPSALVTRAQMAVFLLKSEHGSAYLPPACAGLFADVPCPSTYANWVEQLSNEGVTAGCGGGNYCPDASVTRAQMAVFLLKTSQGSGYVPPAATAIFNDVPVDAFAAAFIDDLYTRGIAGGCSASPLLYCPANPVNRQQMASLLVKTFELP